MRLLLDIGNTRIKWAVQTEQGLDEQQAIAHAGLSAAQLGTQVFAPSGQVSQLLVSNVAGSAMAEQVRQAARDCWQLEPQFVVATATANVAGRILRNAYAEPAKLGSDRWLALLAACALQPGAALVVSAGTALTLDALTAQGQHLGGMIAPGPDLMMSSLMQRTSDIAIRAEQGRQGNEFFADNTLGCVYQGSVQAAVALIESAHARINTTTGGVRLLLTGGAVALLQQHLSLPVQVVPDLVLQGLAAYGQRSDIVAPSQ
ncbi:MAG: type III pantothenate kinase [Steroidobacteraceae bacterium]